MKKTYLAQGLIEWRIQLPLPPNEERKTVDIEFTGGQYTGYGISPARYTTQDPLIQDALERTSWFKSGKIRLM